MSQDQLQQEYDNIRNQVIADLISESQKKIDQLQKVRDGVVSKISKEKKVADELRKRLAKFQRESNKLRKEQEKDS